MARHSCRRELRIIPLALRSSRREPVNCLQKRICLPFLQALNLLETALQVMQAVYRMRRSRSAAARSRWLAAQAMRRKPLRRLTAQENRSVHWQQEQRAYPMELQVLNPLLTTLFCRKYPRSLNKPETFLQSQLMIPARQPGLRQQARWNPVMQE